MDEAIPRYVHVWDPVVRIGHWVLVVAFAVAYVVEKPLLLHVWAGYLVGGVVVLRIVWGVVGPRHARFSDFVCGPATAFAYLRKLLLFHARRYLGHSPAGGIMIVALLISLAATVATGLALYGAEKHAGPLQGLFAQVTAPPPPTAFVAPARAGEDSHDVARRGNAEDTGGEFLEGAHELFANLTLILVALHVAGVLLASAAHRENLVLAMFTGDKRADLPVS